MKNTQYKVFGLSFSLPFKIGFREFVILLAILLPILLIKTCTINVKKGEFKIDKQTVIKK